MTDDEGPASGGQVARQSLLVVANSIVGAGLGYVSLLAMTRYVGKDVYGAQQFALSAIFLLGVVTRLGFPVTHARRLARGEDVGASNGTYLVLKLGLTAAFVALAGTAAWVWFGLLDGEAMDTTPTALLLAALVVVAQGIRDVAVNSFRGLGHILERESVLFTNTLLTVALTVLVALAYAGSHGRWTPLDAGGHAAALLGITSPVGFAHGLALVMGAFLVGDIAALLLAAALFVRARIPVTAPRRSVLQDYWMATLPLMVLSVSGVAAARMNHILLGFFDDAGELADYAGALKLNSLLMLLPNGIAIALLPAVARLDRSGDTAGLQGLMVQTERWVSMLLWPALVLVTLQPAAVIHVLLSDQYLTAAPVLVILAMQALLSSLRIPLQTKALGLGRHATAARVAATALVVDVALALVLIPERLGPIPMAGLGAQGAAWAALGSATFTLVAYRTRAHEWTGHPYFSRHLLRHAMAGVATYAVLRLTLPAAGLLPAERIWTLAAAGLVVLAVYAVALAALKELRVSELRAILLTLRRRIRRPAA